MAWNILILINPTTVLWGYRISKQKIKSGFAARKEKHESRNSGTGREDWCHHERGADLPHRPWRCRESDMALSGKWETGVLPRRTRGG